MAMENWIISTYDVGVHVEYPGEYSLTGFLYDRDNRVIDWSADHRNFTYGNHTMQMAFDGKTIRSQDLTALTDLGNLSLTWGSASMGLIMCDKRDRAHDTASYKASDFVDPSSTDKTIGGSGKGEILLTFSIGAEVPVYQGRYTYDIVGLNMPPISTPVEVNGSKTGYDLRMGGIFLPKKPNNYTVTATGVKNLNVGVMKLQDSYAKFWNSSQRDPVKTRIWVSSQFLANKSGKAKAESDLISPGGSYHIKIFGDAADNATKVGLRMVLVKKLVVNGPFNLAINTTGFPSGSYSIAAKAINGSFSLDDLVIDGLSTGDHQTQ